MSNWLDRIDLSFLIYIVTLIFAAGITYASIDNIKTSLNEAKNTCYENEKRINKVEIDSIVTITKLNQIQVDISDIKKDLCEIKKEILSVKIPANK